MRILEINGQKFKEPTTAQKKDAQERIKKMREEGDKLVKGMFEFLDAQGGWLDFTYRFFPGEPIRVVRINHGEIVDLPMVLVKHLNNIWKKVRTPPKEMTEDGQFKGAPFIERISRTRFTPMDVM